MKKSIIAIMLLIALASCSNPRTDTNTPNLEKQITDLQQANSWLLTENESLKAQIQEQWQKILCRDAPEWTPIITSLSTDSGSVNSTIIINWCNFAWFEGDKLAWIENEAWVKWILYSESWSTDKQLKVILKPDLCQLDNSYSGEVCKAYLNLKPWKYKIFVNPWWKESNLIEFTINDNKPNLP